MLAKLAYKPFGIVLGIAAASVARKTFENGWARSQGTKPPKPTTEEASWTQVLGSAGLQAATFAVTAAVVDRAGAKAFRRVTGFWPGDKRPEPAAELRAGSS